MTSMHSYDQFKGLGVAMVTPFRADGNVDHAALERLVEHLIGGGVDYLVVQGTTGETPTLSIKECEQIIAQIVEIGHHRVPIVLGVGGNNTNALVDHLQKLDLNGVDGILSASPYYNKPSQEGIYQHYKALAQVSMLPIILYNVPGRTSSNITSETTLRLAHDFENICAIKEASGNLDQIGRIIAKRPDGFLVLSGDDALTLPILALGGDGVISVVGNALPEQFSHLVRAARKGEMKVAREEHYKLLELIDALFADGNPGGIKEVLSILGICEKYVRLPLVNVNEATRKRLYAALAEITVVQ